MRGPDILLFLRIVTVPLSVRQRAVLCSILSDSPVSFSILKLAWGLRMVSLAHWLILPVAWWARLHDCSLIALRFQRLWGLLSDLLRHGVITDLIMWNHISAQLQDVIDHVSRKQRCFENKLWVLSHYVCQKKWIETGNPENPAWDDLISSGVSTCGAVSL